MQQKIGIIVSMFPEVHETFILHELLELENKGISFEIYSLQYPRDEVVQDGAQRLSNEKTRYARLFGLQALSALLSSMFRHPLRFFRAIYRVICEGHDQPMELLKSLAILPIALHYGGLARKQGIQHFHGHWANVPTTACWFLGEIEEFTWSAAIHGEDIFTPNRFLRKKLDDSLFTVVCTDHFCKHIQRNMEHRHPEDVHLNYHGLGPKIWQRLQQPRQKSFSDEGRKKILTIGRLVRTKGHDDTIRAFSSLVGSGLDAELVLIGSGPQEKELRALVESVGIAERVTSIWTR